jgi:hypothetical protein
MTEIEIKKINPNEQPELIKLLEHIQQTHKVTEETRKALKDYKKVSGMYHKTVSFKKNLIMGVYISYVAHHTSAGAGKVRVDLQSITLYDSADEYEIEKLKYLVNANPN